ncbi:MAG: hypothetical protein JXA22_05290 [Candidatus Thermoplasmatota archaeon]|nr:hypothetical protein [Candidatus Thermoplasmatota archaeon]
MRPKLFWAWTVALGILLAIIGGFLVVVPYVGLAVMGIGILMMIIGIVALVPILIGEMKREDREMHEKIHEEDLRP